MDKGFKHSNLILIFGVIVFFSLVYGVYYFNEYQKEVIKKTDDKNNEKKMKVNFPSIQNSFLKPKKWSSLKI
jgi:flagellar basal body-associated protein FliL